MNAFNKDIISDESMRQLLQLCVLEGDDNDMLTQQLIDMESNFAFGNEAFNLPLIPGEKLMLNKLKMGLGKSAHLKWLFTGIITVTAAAGVALYDSEKAAPLTQSAPITSNETLIEEVIQAPVTPNIEPETSQPIFPLFKKDTLPYTPEIVVQAPDFKLPLEYFIPPPVYSHPIQLKDSPIIGGKSTLFKRSIPIENGRYEYDTVLDGIKKIEVDGGFCSITVNPTEDKRTTMSSSIEINGKFKKKKGTYEFSCERVGSTLRVYLNPKNVNIYASNLVMDGQLRFDVPDNVVVDLRNSSGDISVTGLKSKNNTIDCRYGKINVRDINGSINLTDGSGSIDAENIVGTLKVDARYGRVELNNIKAESMVTSGSGSVFINHHTGNLKVDARYGNVTINNLDGQLALESSSGSVECNDIKGKQCTIEGKYGNIKLRRIEAELYVIARSGQLDIDELTGNAKVETVYGRQIISDMTGDLTTISRSGDISISRQTGKLTLESVYGNVTLNDCKGKMSLSLRSGNLNALSIELVESLDIVSLYGNIKCQLDNNVNDLSFNLDTPYGKSSIKKDNVDISKENTSLVLKNGNIQIRSQASKGSQQFN